MLRDHKWNRKYTPEDGSLVGNFYIPALKDAGRYDRLTGYFSASALTLASRGIEGLVRSEGGMRLVVGCTLDPPEIEAIKKGERIRSHVENHLVNLPLEPSDRAAHEALELLAWMIARGCLTVKVAVPTDANRNPVSADGIFHEKSGIIEDRKGDRIAWNGSLNETLAGWESNWESINVFTSWSIESDRVDDEERNFERIWENRSSRVMVFDVPDAIRRDLMRFMPKEDMPARLKPEMEQPSTPQSEPETESVKRRVWAFIRRAPLMPNNGDRVGEETSAVVAWPHQVKAFERLYRGWPPKLLIADEVGLGKTVQAGMLLRQAWLAGRAKRILILAPRAVLEQWQIELREKFNFNWPIYDGKKLVWHQSRARRGKSELVVDRDQWHQEPIVIASSHLMRRQDRRKALLEDADAWDLIILDEAHHARRRGAGTQQEKGPNALLSLMLKLKDRTKGLVLLTATPLQVHPIEVWDLLNLLGLPEEWNEKEFLEFFDAARKPNPSKSEFEEMTRLFQSVEHTFGKVKDDDARRLTTMSLLATKTITNALRDRSTIPRRQLDPDKRKASVNLFRAYTPIHYLVSRHTRELLRGYFKKGMLKIPIADRQVDDQFINMTQEEEALYGALGDYITGTYNQAETDKRTAVGFVMTIYRRRFASSFYALRKTLQNHLDAIITDDRSKLVEQDEDAPDDETMDDMLEAADMREYKQQAIACEEESNIRNLLSLIKKLPPDSKLTALKKTLIELGQNHNHKVMVFTQYTDTMDFLRTRLLKDTDLNLICFSGRGGEIPKAEGSWRKISRDQASRQFRDDDEGAVMLCTDAAAEGLNFQFCGALINYDMPWNPMRVEQRIGRIDRLGQQNKVIRIINLHYEGTVETDIYQALKGRIGLFESVVGRLQPILSSLPKQIAQAVLSEKGRGTQDRSRLVDKINRQAQEAKDTGFSIDEMVEEDIAMPQRPAPPVTMDDLDRVISTTSLMPDGVEIQPLGMRQYGLKYPGMKEFVRVTTDPELFREHAGSMELWSPGNILFEPPEFTETGEAASEVERKLKDILDSA